MKRVICLYRVSTVGQVDHDDIPMQKLACREYAASHPDWEIVDEISEKGVSGYKISTNARDAIVEIKKRALLHQFEILPAKWIQSHYSEHPPNPLEIRRFVTVA